MFLSVSILQSVQVVKNTWPALRECSYLSTITHQTKKENLSKNCLFTLTNQWFGGMWIWTQLSYNLHHHTTHFPLLWVITLEMPVAVPHYTLLAMMTTQKMTSV